MNKTKKRGLSIIAFATCLLAMAFSMNEDGVTLRLNLEKGKQFTTQTKTNMLTVMEVQGQSISMPQNIETSFKLQVEDFADGQYTIASTLKKLKFSQSQMGMNFSYDSEHPETTSPMLAETTSQIQKSIDKPFNIVVNQRGKFIESNSNDDVNKLADCKSFFLEYPEETLTVGSSWTTEEKLDSSALAGKTSMTYTVTAINKKKVTLSFTGTLTGDNSTNGTYEGTYIIDKATGLIMEAKIKANASMTVFESGMDIPMTISSTSEYTIK